MNAEPRQTRRLAVPMLLAWVVWSAALPCAAETVDVPAGAFDAAGPSAEPAVQAPVAAPATSATSATSATTAGNWLDDLVFPFSDPLLALPPPLTGPAMLPGDSGAAACSSMAGADFPAALTLADALELALCHHPSVHSARAMVWQQAAQVGEARAAYLPTLAVGVSRLNQKTRYPDSRLSIDSDQTRLSEYATLTWRLLDSGGRSAQKRSANALLGASLADHDAVLQQIIASLAGAYYDAQTASASHAARVQNQKLAAETLEMAIRRTARGAGMQSDILQARTALAKADLEKNRSLSAHDKAIAALVFSMGIPASAASVRELALAPDLPPAGAGPQQRLSDWLAWTVAQHPALLAARSRSRAAREKLAVIRSEGLPSLDFTYSHYLNGRPTQSLSNTRSTETVVGLTANIPLFEGFSRTYKMAGQRAQVDRLEAEQRETENRILAEVAKAHADVMASWRNLEAAGLLLDTARDALADVRLRFDRGIADILDMLSVQRALVDAREEEVRAQSEWRSARLRLLAQAGILGRRDVRNQD